MITLDQNNIIFMFLKYKPGASTSAPSRDKKIAEYGPVQSTLS